MSFRAGSLWAGEDVVQAAYERAIKYHRQFSKEEFAKWFNIVLNNALRDYMAEERGYVPNLGDEEESEEGCPHYPKQIAREIFIRIGKKPQEQCEILMLYFKHKYSAKDIANITNHTYAKSYHIIERFRSELKELYRDS